MSLTYGFYNSSNHDRRYNAIQMSSIFDGIINDGIFMSIGDRFEVLAKGEDMFVTVGEGRAWFNHTWTLNDSPLPIELPQAELILDRYDAIVLEVNAEQAVRANDIKVVSGTPSSNPEYPTLINTSTIHQYPLAYIFVERGVTSVRQADITSMIGKDSAPYVTGIIETIDIESMVRQWEDQWKKFFEEQTKDMGDANEAWKEQWENWFNSYVSEMDDQAEKWNDLWHQWYHMYTNSSAEEFANWKNEQKAEFIAWFSDLKDMLSEQVEAMLAAEIEELKKRTSALEVFEENMAKDQTIYDDILDSDGDTITDSIGDPIESRIIFTGGGSEEVYIGNTEPSPGYKLWVNPDDNSPGGGGSGTADLSVVSDKFSASESYEKGSYCIYQDTLYRFTEAKDPGPWDDSLVEATNVGKELTSMGGVLLWENPDPSKAFEEQTINLLSDDYNTYEFYYKTATVSNDIMVAKSIKGRGTTTPYLSVDNRTLIGGLRNIKYINETTYQVSNSTYYNGFNPTTENIMCIPLKIIGYKL